MEKVNIFLIQAIFLALLFIFNPNANSSESKYVIDYECALFLKPDVTSKWKKISNPIVSIEIPQDNLNGTVLHIPIDNNKYEILIAIDFPQEITNQKFIKQTISILEEEVNPEAEPWDEPINSFETAELTFLLHQDKSIIFVFQPLIIKSAELKIEFKAKWKIIL